MDMMMTTTTTIIKIGEGMSSNETLDQCLFFIFLKCFEAVENISCFACRV